MTRTELARLCATHGIEPSYVDMDGKRRNVPVATLRALADIFGIDAPRSRPPATIAEARAATDAPRCFVPETLERARVWGITCQLPSLVSRRNLGMGDLADLADLCRIAADAGADFVGVNPLHALFWSAPERISPFFPSTRRFLNPAYVAVDWIEGAEMTADERAEAERLRDGEMIDFAASVRLKDRVLRRVHARWHWTGDDRRAHERFVADNGEALRAHALFEALSEAMAAAGHGAGWRGWPDAYRDRHGEAVQRFAREHAARIDYHVWLQWLADSQLGRVRAEAERAGLRVGLYLDVAVGAADDGSATWTDPDLTVPALSVGAPPDPLGPIGQDWGLAPLSPPRLEQTDAAPFADTIGAVMRHAGALRIDHAMGLARMWLIPRGTEPLKGAYMRYPLERMLRRLAQASRAHGTMIVGEDLGLVPPGFSELIRSRALHSYLVFLIGSEGAALPDPAHWPREALACLATHDMPTFTGWWRSADIEVRHELGLEDDERRAMRLAARRLAKAQVIAVTGDLADEAQISASLHAHVAGAPSRLFALQIEDALGVPHQINVPGTVDEYPNWRRRLPVALDALSAQPGFLAHADALARVRPR